MATESVTATNAALDALSRGANAVDAAIVASLVAGIAVPVSSGIGGGGFAMVWDAKSHTATILDYRETAPAALDPSTFDTRDVAAGLKVGVPGEVAGLIEMHKRWGKRPLSEDFEDAAKLAEQGFALPPHMARSLLMKFSQDVPKLSVLGPMLFPQGTAAQAGDHVSNPKLAATLRRIGREGASAFYEGPIARSIVETVQKAGGVLTEQDLRDYKVIERQPLKAKWDKFEIVTMPPPSAGGVMLLQTLGMFTKDELAKMPATEPEGMHTLGEAIRASLADRLQFVADPAARPVNTAKLLDPQMLAARRASIKPNETRPPSAFVMQEHGTTHLIVVDAEQNIVSLTTTVNGPFGSRLVAEEPGILLNDEMTDFLSRPLSGKLGISDPAGATHAGVRPPSSMMPTLVLENGEPVLTLGGSGGYRIATGVPQVALGVLAQGLSVDEAVRRPRFHVTFDGTLLVEKGALSPEAVKDLEARGEKLREEDNISAVQAISFERKGAEVQVSVAADPRKYGAGLIGPR